MYVFPSVPAIDPTTGPIFNTSGQVYAPSDTTFSTPLTVTDLAGAPMTSVSIGEQAITAPFETVDVPIVVWKSGAYILTLWSPQALIDAAEAAAADAAASAASSAAVQDQLNAAPQLLPAGGSTGDVLYRAGERVGVWAAPTGGTGGTGGVSDWNTLLNKPTTFPPDAHTHPAGQISDATTVGKAVMTAADAQAARAAIGAGTGNGTSNLTLGTAATQAAPGNHSHPASAISFVPTGSISATDVQTAIGQAALTGGGAGGTSQIQVWEYASGAYPALSATQPPGVRVLWALGPTFPPTVPSWVGLGAGKVRLKYEYLALA